VNRRRKERGIDRMKGKMIMKKEAEKQRESII
jgi:hypothetical protein